MRVVETRIERDADCDCAWWWRWRVVRSTEVRLAGVWAQHNEVLAHAVTRWGARRKLKIAK